MSRISELFSKKKGRVLNIYFTAGYPQRNDTLPLMEALQENGADLIELGIPYSDPLADGPVIQQSSSVALQQGMSLAVLFEQLKGFRSRVGLPVILMGYMNPVLQYGFERFCADAAAVGIDGLILPDLPEFEFESEYGPIIRKYKLDFIFLITPETSKERVRQLDSLSTGFLYAVASSATTGKDTDMKEVSSYVSRVKSYGITNPVLIGFGIKDKKSFQEACAVAEGAIIGSAFIRHLGATTGDIKERVKQFLQQII
jgi:tryptophan synthase alpha chain